MSAPHCVNKLKLHGNISIYADMHTYINAIKNKINTNSKIKIKNLIFYAAG